MSRSPLGAAAIAAEFDTTLDKYAGFIHSLRRRFEILRGEERLLKRQGGGEDIAIDALVEACGDVHVGLETTDRLFTRLLQCPVPQITYRSERHP
ncbi:MAG: hypothetical protein QNJ91_08795 [Gammaproteobacteria bacterium]|nr:hypothetical protein [Gammaproteobacteria bacterium]